MNSLQKSKVYGNYPPPAFYFLLGIFLFFSWNGYSAEYHWISGSTGSFTDSTKYVEGVAPGLGDWGVVTGGTNTINVASSETKESNSFYGGRSLLLTGGNTTVSNAGIYLCDDSAITLDGDESTLFTANGTIRVGHLGEGTATLNVHGGTLIAKSWFVAGRVNPGLINLTGGKIQIESANSFKLCDTSNSSGTLLISGGVFENKSAPFYIGGATGGQAYVELSQTGTLTSEKYIHFSGSPNSSSEFRMTGGTFLANAGIGMGNGQNSQAVLDISGGNATVKEKFVIGNAKGANAAVSVSGGTLTSEIAIAVGNVSGATGSLSVSAGTLTSSGNNILVGYAADSTGTLSVSGGGSLTAKNIQVAVNAGSTGTMDVSGGTVQASEIHLNWTGADDTPTATSQYTQSGGTVTTARLQAGGNSEIRVSGGELIIGSQSYWGENTHLVQTGGTILFKNTLRTGIFDSIKNASGMTVLDIAGGTLKGNGWFGFGYGNTTEVNVHTGGTLQQGLTDKNSRLVVGDGNSTTLTLAGGKIETCSLLVTAKGTLRLNAASSGFGSIISSDSTTYDPYAIQGKVQWGIQTGATVLSADSFQNVITSSQETAAFSTGVQGIWNVTQNDAKTAYSVQLAEGSKLGETYQNLGSTYLFANPMESGWIALDRNVTSLGNYEVSLFLDNQEGGSLSDLALWMENLLQYDPGLDLLAYDETQNSLTLHGFASEMGERFLAFDFSQYNELMGTSFMVNGFSANAVPEPSTLLLLLAGMFFFLWKKRRP